MESIFRIQIPFLQITSPTPQNLHYPFSRRLNYLYPIPYSIPLSPRCQNSERRRASMPPRDVCNVFAKTVSNIVKCHNYALKTMHHLIMIGKINKPAVFEKFTFPTLYPSTNIFLIL